MTTSRDDVTFYPEEASLDELNNQLSKRMDLLKGKNEVDDRNEIQEGIVILRKIILLRMLKEIVNDTRWDEKGRARTNLYNGRTPDTVEKLRDILNSNKKMDDKFAQIQSLIKSKSESMHPWYDMTNNEKQILKIKKVAGFCAGLDTQIYKFNRKPDENELFALQVESLQNLQKDIYPNYDVDKKKLKILDRYVNDVIFWSDKGNKKNKINEKLFDFTPTFILECRKILADNSITQSEKIERIKEVVKNKVDNSHSLEKHKKNISNLFYSGESGERAESEMKQHVSAIKTIQKTRGSKAASLLNNLEKIINNEFWNDKAMSVIKNPPDGIVKCRAILNSKLSPSEKIHAIFLILQDKANLHDERSRAVFFKKSTHPDVTNLYNQMKEMSSKWHSKDVVKYDFDKKLKEASAILTKEKPSVAYTRPIHGRF